MIPGGLWGRDQAKEAIEQNQSGSANSEPRTALSSGDDQLLG